jgi:hypothetical protein
VLFSRSGSGCIESKACCILLATDFRWSRHATCTLGGSAKEQALASLTEIEHGLYAGIGLWAHHSRWWQLLLIIIRAQLKLAGKKFDEFATAVRQDGVGLLLLCINQGKAPADQPGLLEQKLDLPTSNVCNEFH